MLYTIHARRRIFWMAAIAALSAGGQSTAADPASTWKPACASRAMRMIFSTLAELSLIPAIFGWAESSTTASAATSVATSTATFPATAATSLATWPAVAGPARTTGVAVGADAVAGRAPYARIAVSVRATVCSSLRSNQVP